MGPNTNVGAGQGLRSTTWLQNIDMSVEKNIQFEVFGRDQVERPLSHIGTIHAPNQQLAVGRAKYMYSERKWVELCVAPADVFVSCLNPDRVGIVGMA